MGTLRYRGTVRTARVGSQCTFEFTIEEDDLPEREVERNVAIEKIAQEALWESGVFEWGYEQIAKEP